MDKTWLGVRYLEQLPLNFSTKSLKAENRSFSHPSGQLRGSSKLSFERKNLNLSQLITAPNTGKPFVSENKMLVEIFVRL